MASSVSASGSPPSVTPTDLMLPTTTAVPAEAAATATTNPEDLNCPVYGPGDDLLISQVSADTKTYFTIYIISVLPQGKHLHVATFKKYFFQPCTGLINMQIFLVVWSSCYPKSNCRKGHVLE